MDEPSYQVQSLDITTIVFMLKNNYKNESQNIKDKVNDIIIQLIKEGKIKENCGSERLYYTFIHKEYIKLINDNLQQ